MADPLAGTTDAPDIGPPQADAADALSGFSVAAPVFAGKVADGANTLAASNPQPKAPGAWARSIMGGVMDALSGFGAGGKVPEGAGGLYGVGAAARQISARKEAQEQQQFDNAQKQQAMSREDQIASANIAHENAATVYQQKLSSRLSYDAQQDNIKNDTAALQPFIAAGAPMVRKD